MAAGEKPYRVYRGGRVKGKVPLQSRPERDGGRRPDGKTPALRRSRTRRPWSWRRRLGVGLIVLIVLLVVWALVGYLSFRSGVPGRARR